MAAFYRLSGKYILRGWDKLPYAIVNDSTKAVFFLTSDQMRVLSRCNGEWDFLILLLRLTKTENAPKNSFPKALSNNAEKVMEFHPVRNICSIPTVMSALYTSA